MPYDSKSLVCRDYSSLISRYGHFFEFGKRWGSHKKFFLEQQELLFSTNGYFYGPLRNHLGLRDESLYKKIFLLRHPLDTCISAFYSFSKTHTLPRDRRTQEVFQTFRNTILQSTLFEFSMNYLTDKLIPLYESYIQAIKDDESGFTKIILYEDFVVNPEPILNEIMKVINPSIGYKREQYIKKMCKKHSFVQKSQNPHSHQRSGSSGQYLNAFTKQELDTLRHKLTKYEILTEIYHLQPNI